jgi:glycosyltransferase involved in cell wall biosynthesis
LAKIRRKPFLLEVRDLWPAFAIDIGVLTNPFLIVLSSWLEKFLYEQADHILVNSPAYSDYIHDRGIPSEEISLIPNGVNPDMFHLDIQETSIRQQWNLEKKCIVTYTGALGMANDIPTILHAAKRLQEEMKIHFLLVGDGKERRNLEKLAKQLRLTNVTFTGSYPKTDIPSVLTASDVCVATLKDISMFRTTYPNKVFDYMASGRPTILGIDGVIRKVIEASEGGIFVPPGDDVALADAVYQLCGDEVLRNTMGQKARKYVVSHFNRELHAQAFYELVTRLVFKD